MLYRARSTDNYTICSKDGTIGRVREFLFDDQKWNVRYMVADTGTWFPGRKVLVSPEFMLELSQEKQCINVDLVKKQIKDSPPLSSDKPVDRQKDNPGWGFFLLPESPLTKLPDDQDIQNDLNRRELEERREEERSWDRHLRSTLAATGITIEAPDGEVGQIEDFIVDDTNWDIRYFIVKTSGWWPGHHVLVAPPWVSKMNWGTSKLFIDVNREPFRTLEEFKSLEMLTRDYETRLYQSCNRIGYWADDPNCQ